MAWDTELVKTFERISIAHYPDFVDSSANATTGYVIWRKIDQVDFDFLDVRGYSNIIVALEIRAYSRAKVQELTREVVNDLWQNGHLITVDTVEWRHYIDVEPKQRGTYLALMLREFPNVGRLDGMGDFILPRQSLFYDDAMVWDIELVKTFNWARVQAWPDFVEGTPDYDQGHVVWRQSDEVVDDFLDVAPTCNIEVDLHFQARTRARVQQIMSDVLGQMESRGQLIRQETAQWYYDEVQKVRGSLVTVLVRSDPGFLPDRPEGEFSTAFNPMEFDVLQEA